jgi:PAS domain S-box-containing protein
MGAKKSAKTKQHYRRKTDVKIPPKMSLLANNISTDNSEINNILNVMEKLLHWAAIIEYSDDAIISKSVDGIITSWNKGAERLYGYKAEEIIGKPVSVLMPPSKKDDFPYIMKQLHDGKRVEHYETERVTKYGKIMQVSLTVSPIKDSNGKIIGASKIARDITDKFEYEKRRDEFISTASHELKTPLTSQKAFGELLEQTIVKKGYDDLLPYIQRINKQTDKLKKLIEDLLELSRIQSGRLLMEYKKFKIDDLIQETVANTQLTTKHKIILEGESKNFVKGDRERLGQVITNLLSNAIKYSPQSKKVRIEIKNVKDYVQICIQDYGIGIDKDFHQRIFERFFRVTGHDEKTFPGMGIGLHVSQEIIKRHNGDIWVESTKGKGSKFYFTVPLHRINK